MRQTLLLSGILMLLAGGCAPTFSGQWLEEARTPRPGDIKDRDYVRMALDFDPISSVRVGIYNEAAGVVDEESVQMDQYLVYDGGRTAQFGAGTARLEGDHLSANVAGVSRKFDRVRGPSIFPPIVKLPSLIDSNPPTRDRYATASP